MKFTYAEYFLGIGAPGKGIHRVTERHGDKCEFVYGFEIDKHARNAFCAIHGVDEDKIYHDITNQPEELPYVDIVFYSPPCQTFSLAGKREGTTVDKGNLFYNALEGIKKSKPKYAIMENVANLKNQFKDDFNAMIKTLDDAGYVNYAQVLNAKDYGIPQNRERIFIVSIRKDIYKQGIRFEFPKPIKLEKRLKDVLESEVNAKYYLSEKIISRFIEKPIGEDVIGTTAPESRSIGQRDLVYGIENCVGTLTATDYKRPKQIMVNQIGNISESKSFNGNPQTGRIYGTDGLSPTLSTMQGGGQEPKIMVKSATKDGCETAQQGDSINPEHPNSDTRRGRVGKGIAQTLTTSCNQGVFLPCIAASRGRDSSRYTGNKNIEQQLELNKEDISNALTTVQKDNYVIEPDIRIRKLTPLECFRLQGFDDEDYYKAVKAYNKKWKPGASDSQMYKRAGNSIPVNIEEEILENLIYQRKQSGSQIGLY